MSNTLVLTQTPISLVVVVLTGYKAVLGAMRRREDFCDSAELSQILTFSVLLRFWLNHVLLCV